MIQSSLPAATTDARTVSERSLSRLYDGLMRLPIIAFELFFLVREVLGMRVLVARHPYIDRDWWFVLNLAGRMSICLFIVVLIGLHVCRRRPVTKYDEWRPKIDALAGTLLTYLVLATPRSAPVPLWDGLSLLFTLLGSIFAIFAVLDLGRSLSVMPEARKLVTNGLYQRIRHPLYLAEEIATIGFCLQFRSWQAVAILAIHFYFQVRRMEWEETILSRAFPEYVAYRGGTYRLIPGVY